MKITLTFLSAVLLISCSENKTPDFLTYQFDKQATLIIKTVDNDSLPKIAGSYISLLPPDYIRNYAQADLTVDSNKFILTYNLSSPAETDLFIDGYELSVFLIPGDTLYMTMGSPNAQTFVETIKYDGKSSPINSYLLSRHQNLGDNFIQKCARVLNSSLGPEKIITSVDSILTTETDFLNNYNKRSLLPEWYVEYERNQFLYYSAIARAVSKDEKISSTVLNEVKLNNNAAILCSNYYGFLHVYFSNTLYKEFKQMDVEGRRKIYGIKVLQLTDSLLTGEVEEIFKCYAITSFIIDNGMYDLAAKIINNEKQKFADKKYIGYLERYLRDRMTLKPGTSAPGFYLMDSRNEYKYLSDFKGSVLLLNFWFPGCAGCKMEIPFEHKLIEIFKSEKFHLINICLFTTQETWEKVIAKLGMKGINLFAEGNWQKKLIENYKISSYPHYTLIDKNGKVVSNNPQRPSEGLKDEILNLLNN